MDKPKTRPWYKKKRYLVLLGLIAVITFAGIGNAAKSTNTSSSAPTHTQTTPVTIPAPGLNNNLSNNNYYTNVNGNQVHSPAYSNTVPVGASAQCGDGTYSFSQHHQGTCSHHGGVASWL